MTINAYTTVHLTCPGQQFIKAAHLYNAFESMQVSTIRISIMPLGLPLTNAHNQSFLLL